MYTARLRSRVIPTVASLIILTACSLEQPVRIDPVSVAVSNIAYGYNEKLLEVSKLAPLFGGMFYDRDGVMNAYVKANLDTLLVSEVEASALVLEGAITTVFNEAILTRELKGSDSKEGAIKLLEGQYDFAELYTWYEKLVTLLSSFPSILSTDINEAQNRLVIKVKNLAVESDIRKALAKLDIPGEAVLLKEGEADYPQALLTDRKRPLKGGLAVARSGVGACTMGLQVTIGGVRGFIATSHCSTKMFSKENSQYYQPGSTTANSFAGTEFRDNPYVTSPADRRCPANYACRSSDSSFASYSSGVIGIQNNGEIYRTTLIGPGTGYGSITINTTPKPNDEYIEFFKMSGKQYDNPVGTILHKVGRTTGWNEGRVVETDFDSQQAGTIDGRQRFIFSNTRVQASAEGGDSGSPVFSRRLVNGTYLHYFSGILWGSPNGVSSGDTYVFSDVGQVEKDMGTITVR